MDPPTNGPAAVASRDCYAPLNIPEALRDAVRLDGNAFLTPIARVRR